MTGHRLGPGADDLTLVICRDLTARHAAEVTASYLAAIVESSDEAIVDTDTDGYLTSWNPAAERLYGYGRDGAIGEHIDLIIPTDHREHMSGLLDRVRQGERLDHHRTVRRAKDGLRSRSRSPSPPSPTQPAS